MGARVEAAFLAASVFVVAACSNAEFAASVPDAGGDATIADSDAASGPAVDGGPAADGGRRADGGTGVDAAPVSVRCGATACAGGTSCCWTEPEDAGCTAAGACPGTEIVCDEPSDCTAGRPAGFGCCVSVSNSALNYSQCAKLAAGACPGDLIHACNPNAAGDPCPSGGSCVPFLTWNGGAMYHACQL